MGGVRSDREATAASAPVTMSESLKQDSPRAASVELWLLRGSV